MRCLINALKPQMFTLSCSKFNLVAFVGAALLLASCQSDATATRLGDTELEVSKGPMEGGVLLLKPGVAFIKPGEAPLKPQKQLFVDAKATKTTFLNVSTQDLIFFAAGQDYVEDTCVFMVHVKAQTRAFEMKTNKNIL